MQEKTSKSTKKTTIQSAPTQKKSKKKIATSTSVTTTSTIASIAVTSTLTTCATTSASIADRVPLESNSNAYEEAVMMDFANVSLDEPFSIDFTESESDTK